MTASETRTKLLGLELLRFACALAVLVYHYRHFYEIPGAAPFAVDAQPLAGVLFPFYRLGLFGVQMFWGISGFIFFWKYAEPIASSAVNGARFFTFRFSRLYPLHFVTLLLVASLQPLYAWIAGHPFVYDGNTAGQFLQQLMLATQWGKQADFTFNGPIWSVSAEVFVYALFFLIVKRFGNRLAPTLVVLSVASLAFLAGSGAPIVHCLRFFFIGGLAAQLHRRFGDSRELRLCAWALLAFAFAWPVARGTLGSADAMDLLIFTGLPAAMILLAKDPPILKRASVPIEAAGNLTYASYLCHFPLQLIAALLCVAAGLTPPVDSPWFLVAYVATTLAVARVVFVQFERPAQRWLRTAPWRRSVLPA